MGNSKILPDFVIGMGAFSKLITACSCGSDLVLEMVIELLMFLWMQFEPAPRRGEPDVTRRTPDYFL